MLMKTYASLRRFLPKNNCKFGVLFACTVASFLDCWSSSRLHFGRPEGSGAPFWEPRGRSLDVLRSVGLHFGCSGSRLGTFLGALGVVWAPFWRLWGTLGLHFGGFGGPVAAFGGPWGRPWPPKGPKVKFSQFYPSILGSFCLHVGGKHRSKI